MNECMKLAPHSTLSLALSTPIFFPLGSSEFLPTSAALCFVFPGADLGFAGPETCVTRGGRYAGCVFKKPSHAKQLRLLPGRNFIKAMNLVGGGHHSS